MDVAALAAQTRISQRQITAIEAGDYAALPGRTYAIGFSRTLARSVGLNEAEIAASTRAELFSTQPSDQHRQVQTFEPGDPARVPSAKLTWLALGGVAAAVVAGIAFLPSLFSPGGALPSILPQDRPAAANVLVGQAPALAPAPTGPVMFTALQDGVWVKFYDRAGTQLMQKELALGETYTVPGDKGEVLLWTARPNQLGITIGGQTVAKLAEVQTTMKDVPVSAAALLARGAAAAGPATAGAPATAASAPVQFRNSAAAPAPRVQRNPAPRLEASPAPASLPGVGAPTPAITSGPSRAASPGAASPVPAPSAT